MTLQACSREMATLALQSPKSSPTKGVSVASAHTGDVIRMSQDVALLAEQMKTQRKTLTAQISSLEEANVSGAQLLGVGIALTAAVIAMLLVLGFVRLNLSIVCNTHTLKLTVNALHGRPTRPRSAIRWKPWPEKSRHYRPSLRLSPVMYLMHTHKAVQLASRVWPAPMKSTLSCHNSSSSWQRKAELRSSTTPPNWLCWRLTRFGTSVVYPPPLTLLVGLFRLTADLSMFALQRRTSSKSCPMLAMQATACCMISLRTSKRTRCTWSGGSRNVLSMAGSSLLLLACFARRYWLTS
jgi:hypothetical protein